MLVDGLSHLNYETWDFAHQHETPKTHYIIAASHRSGSNWLCHILWRTGLFGAPHEYFNKNMTFRSLAARLNVTDHVGYIKSLYSKRASPNGVFGVKILYQQWNFSKKFVENFSCDIDDIRVLFLDRQDKLSQAISYARAVTTQQWTSAAIEQSTPIYDPSLIKRAYLDLLRQREGWERIFKEMGWSPLRIAYEDMCADVNDVLAKIYQHTGVTEWGGAAVNIPELIQQRDTLTKNWIERFSTEEASFLDEMQDRGDKPANNQSIQTVLPMIDQEFMLLQGEIAWLMERSRRHRHLFVADLDWLVVPPVALKQARLFRDPGRATGQSRSAGTAVALVSWAFVSDEVDRRLKGGIIQLKPADWRSGPYPWIIDVVAPFGGAAEALANVTNTVFGGKTVPIANGKIRPPE